VIHRSQRHFLLAAVASVLAARGLYLLCFGGDAFWMNHNLLVEARGFALGVEVESHGLPLVTFLLWALRWAGLGADVAVAALYLLAHLVFLLATLRLADFAWPQGLPRQRWILVLTIAFVPVLSSQEGFRNLGILLGAALLAGAVALAIDSAGVGSRGWTALGAILLAALGAACRIEALAGAAAGGIALLLPGPQATGLVRSRRAGAALLAGVALGILAALALRYAVVGRFELTGSQYAFYTFYDGLPWFLSSEVPELTGEYGRYLASMEHFGSYESNEGSLFRALLSNPGVAVLRFVLKVPELVGSLGWLAGVTPVGLAAAVVAAWGRVGAWWRGGGRAQARWYLPFAAAAAALFAPPPGSYYWLIPLPPVLLLIAAGFDRILARASNRLVRGLAALAAALGTLAIGLYGKHDTTTSPAANEAARYLERRCREGCLLNYLPDAIKARAWVDLEAGAPFPFKPRREEAVVLGRYPPGFRRACRFDERVRKARRAGYRGPVLYLRATFPKHVALLDTLNDPEARFEGRVDLSGASVEARFRDDAGEIVLYAMPPSWPER
jgi:hypothetical protein